MELFETISACFRQTKCVHHQFPMGKHIAYYSCLAFVRTIATVHLNQSGGLQKHRSIVHKAVDTILDAKRGYNDVGGVVFRVKCTFSRRIILFLALKQNSRRVSEIFQFKAFNRKGFSRYMMARDFRITMICPH